MRLTANPDGMGGSGPKPGIGSPPVKLNPGSTQTPIGPAPSVPPKPSAPLPPLGPPPATAGAPAVEAPSKIRALDQKLGAGLGRHEDSWTRTPNTTGTGAIHVRSFHCKLNGDSLDNLDKQINEWLDAHPQYEVKFVTTSVGDWTGKIKEPALIVQVWV